MVSVPKKHGCTVFYSTCCRVLDFLGDVSDNSLLPNTIDYSCNALENPADIVSPIRYDFTVLETLSCTRENMEKPDRFQTTNSQTNAIQMLLTTSSTQLDLDETKN